MNKQYLKSLSRYHFAELMRRHENLMKLIEQVGRTQTDFYKRLVKEYDLILAEYYGGRE